MPQGSSPMALRWQVAACCVAHVIDMAERQAESDFERWMTWAVVEQSKDSKPAIIHWWT